MKNIKNHLVISCVFLTLLSCKKKEIALEAILIDDLSNIELKLFKNNYFEVSANTLFSSEIFKGNYIKLKDTIIFQDKPYDNNFIPKKIYIFNDKIILRENKKGEIDTSFASYFKIIKTD